ncbi:type IV secretory system conjugative DNA transfer family protein [Xanthomonas sp. MUS 060]|uniref:type IV secretory system conjugative DNA transfer family protein n=1 Tax=Xanthomonas sp. MUS 060 TaxID=1588031 RepID=UPI00210184FD|nr:type IV secretory system conjugative DNA transfer family protein [Xanthomonas sp. MUS 060]
MGFKTIRRKHRSHGSGAQGSSYNINYTEEKRALMLPQELKELPSDEAGAVIPRRMQADPLQEELVLQG